MKVSFYAAFVVFFVIFFQNCGPSQISPGESEELGENSVFSGDEPAQSGAGNGAIFEGKVYGVVSNRICEDESPFKHLHVVFSADRVFEYRRNCKRVPIQEISSEISEFTSESYSYLSEVFFPVEKLNLSIDDVPPVLTSSSPSQTSTVPTYQSCSGNTGISDQLAGGETCNAGRTMEHAGSISCEFNCGDDVVDRVGTCNNGNLEFSGACASPVAPGSSGAVTPIFDSCKGSTFAGCQILPAEHGKHSGRCDHPYEGVCDFKCEDGKWKKISYNCFSEDQSN